MAIIITSALPTAPPEPLIDVTFSDEPCCGHRLAELVQVLTGCTAERAELAVGEAMPQRPTSGEDALRALAQALVRVRATARPSDRL